MKKVAVIQSNYIPWKGYFDIINDVDLFIFYDAVQFTKNDWRNRNKIKTAKGASWLTIPVGRCIDRLICEVKIDDSRWAKRHWETICQFYERAPYFKQYKDFFAEAYLKKNWASLSELNQFLIKHIAWDILGLKTEFKDSRDFKLSGGKTDRLIGLLKKAGADVYYSGPAAKNYLEEEKFKANKIKLIYKDYTGYPEYPQLFPPFVHEVSILDLIFNVGPAAPYYIWGWRDNSQGTADKDIS